MAPTHSTTSFLTSFEAHWDRAAAVPPGSFVPLSELTTAPAGPPFGFIDKIQGTDVIEALSRDRIFLSGWAGSARVGENIREVGLFVGDNQLASVTKFYARPEVVAAFNRPDLLNTGWRAFFYLPILKKGKYELTARAVTDSGTTGELPSFKLSILD
jgi:hypothetical protein